MFAPTRRTYFPSLARRQWVDASRWHSVSELAARQKQRSLDGWQPCRGKIPEMLVREAIHARDADAIWAILAPVIRAGETYPLPRDMDRESALAYWFASGHEVFVAEDCGEIVGSYFLQANQRGGGAHVA